MNYHISEHAGVLLHVDYTKDEAGIPTFECVRVMDANYRPIGPNLRHLLDTAMLLTPCPGEPDTQAAESVLSAITGEIQ